MSKVDATRVRRHPIPQEDKRHQIEKRGTLWVILQTWDRSKHSGPDCPEVTKNSTHNPKQTDENSPCCERPFQGTTTVKENSSPQKKGMRHWCEAYRALCKSPSTHWSRKDSFMSKSSFSQIPDISVSTLTLYWDPRSAQVCTRFEEEQEPAAATSSLCRCLCVSYHGCPQMK